MRKIFSLMLMSLTILLLFSTASVRVGGQEPTTTIKLVPGTIDVDINETFSVDVTIANVTDLYGWQLKLLWDKTLLNCTDAEIHMPDIWHPDGIPDSGDELFFEVPGIGINRAEGYYFAGVVALNPAPSFSGTLTVVTLNFTCLASGTSQLTFDTGVTGTVLGDSLGRSIPFKTVGGQTVGPPTEGGTPPVITPFMIATIVIIIIVIATIVAVILKRARAKKEEVGLEQEEIPPAVQFRVPTYRE